MKYYSLDELESLIELLHLDNSKLKKNIDTIINNIVQVPHIDDMHNITYVIKQSNDILNEVLKYIASEQKVLKVHDSSNNELLKIVMNSGIIYDNKLGHLIRMDIHHSLSIASENHKALSKYSGGINQEFITRRYVNMVVSLATLLLFRFGKYEEDKRADNDPRSNEDFNPEDFVNSDEPPYSK